jgi:hypothetical protein
MAQIPHAEKGLDCPLWRKDMSLVCQACPWWIQLRGKHPQSEQDIDRWGCAVGWLPMLLIEGAQQTRQAGAAIESFRNEMVQGQAAFVDAIERRSSELQVTNSETNSE